jgi:L-asparagine oxygenase
MSLLELTKDEIEILIQLSELITESPSDNPDLYCKQLKELSRQLPENIHRVLSNFAKYGSDTGFLLIRCIPMSNLPNTPSNNNEKIGETTTLAKIQGILVSIIGDMISYEAEGYGRLYQDVVPVRSMANNQTSVGSYTELEIHTEQAFSKLRPDMISLACIRGDKDALTYILPVKQIIDQLTTEEIQLLRQPLWKTGVDLSFKLNGHEFIDGDIRGPLSIIHGSTNDPFLIFDQDLMFGLTTESTDMIKRIVDIYFTHRISHNLIAGEIILIDNHRAVHGRSPYYPNYNGYDRFLTRCFITTDYEKSDHSRVGRMISAIHS